jgi:hypothetical protein
MKSAHKLYVGMAHEGVEVMVVTAAVEVEVVVEEEMAVMCQLAAEASWEVDDGRKSAVEGMDSSDPPLGSHHVFKRCLSERVERNGRASRALDVVHVRRLQRASRVQCARK